MGRDCHVFSWLLFVFLTSLFDRRSHCGMAVLVHLLVLWGHRWLLDLLAVCVGGWPRRFLHLSSRKGTTPPVTSVKHRIADEIFPFSMCLLKTFDSFSSLLLLFFTSRIWIAFASSKSSSFWPAFHCLSRQPMIFDMDPSTSRLVFGSTRWGKINAA